MAKLNHQPKICHIRNGCIFRKGFPSVSCLNCFKFDKPDIFFKCSRYIYMFIRNGFVGISNRFKEPFYSSSIFYVLKSEKKVFCWEKKKNNFPFMQNHLSIFSALMLKITARNLVHLMSTDWRVSFRNFVSHICSYRYSNHIDPIHFMENIYNISFSHMVYAVWQNKNLIYASSHVTLIIFFCWFFLFLLRIKWVRANQETNLTCHFERTSMSQSI